MLVEGRGLRRGAPGQRSRMEPPPWPHRPGMVETDAAWCWCRCSFHHPLPPHVREGVRQRRGHRTGEERRRPHPDTGGHGDGADRWGGGGGRHGRSSSVKYRWSRRWRSALRSAAASGGAAARRCGGGGTLCGWEGNVVCVPIVEDALVKGFETEMSERGYPSLGCKKLTIILRLAIHPLVPY